MADTAEFQLYDADGVARELDAMADRIAATCDPPLATLGILRRGGPIAGELNERLEERLGGSVPSDELKLKRYDDDLTLLHEKPQLQEGDLEIDLEGRTTLLVDDVLYSGRTMFKAAAHVDGMGPASIEPVVLCSRGANEVPIHAHYTACQLDVGEGNIVEVHAPPYEDDWGIYLRRQPDA